MCKNFLIQKKIEMKFVWKHKYRFIYNEFWLCIYNSNISKTTSQSVSKLETAWKADPVKDVHKIQYQFEAKLMGYNKGK